MTLKGYWGVQTAASWRPPNTYLPVSQEKLELNALLAERDRTAAADSRTEAERWCGDPPAGRSALDLKLANGNKPKNFLAIEPSDSRLFAAATTNLLKRRNVQNRRRHKTG